MAKTNKNKKCFFIRDMSTGMFAHPIVDDRKEIDVELKYKTDTQRNFKVKLTRDVLIDWQTTPPESFLYSEDDVRLFFKKLTENVLPTWEVIECTKNNEYITSLPAMCYM